MEISFCELRTKEVVNICDGKKLGNIVDIVFNSCTCKITGIVVPGERSFFSFIKSNPDVFIPFCKIRKIGKDVILVELNPVSTNQVRTMENVSTNTENLENNTEQNTKNNLDLEQQDA